MNDREKELLFGGKVNAQIESVLNSKVLTHKEKGCFSICNSQKTFI